MAEGERRVSQGAPAGSAEPLRPPHSRQIVRKYPEQRRPAPGQEGKQSPHVDQFPLDVGQQGVSPEDPLFEVVHHHCGDLARIGYPSANPPLQIACRAFIPLHPPDDLKGPWC